MKENAKQGMTGLYRHRTIDMTTCCFYIKSKKWLKIKKICAMECITLTAFMDNMVDTFIEAYEKRNGPVVVEERKKGAFRTIAALFDGKNPF